MTDLKKPQPDDVPGQQLLPLIGAVLELDGKNQALRAESDRLRKEIRDLQATLSESAANGGTWPV